MSRSFAGNGCSAWSRADAGRRSGGRGAGVHARHQGCGVDQNGVRVGPNPICRCKGKGHWVTTAGSAGVPLGSGEVAEGGARTSDPSPRPLPRREYSTRHDYNLPVAINRHSIVPGGWTHEQDNTKAQRGPDGKLTPLVREFGFNNYTRIADDTSEACDFSAAYDYWHKTGDFWARVRGEWATRMAAGSGIRLKTRVDGMQLIGPLAGQAARAARGETVTDADIVSLFDQWVAAPDGASGTNGR